MTEEVLRAIQMTDDEVPLDMVLDTPGRLVLAAPQIPQAVRDHKSKVTVFMPHTRCRETRLLRSPTDEIVMCKQSVLGAIDPQLGDSPAASLLKVVEVCQFAPTCRTKSSMSVYPHSVRTQGGGGVEDLPAPRQKEA